MLHNINLLLVPYILLSVLLTGCFTNENQQANKNEIGVITNEFADDFVSQIHTHKDLKDTKWLVRKLPEANTHQLESLLNAFSSVKDSVSFHPIKERILKENINDDLFAIGMNALGLLAPKDSTSALIEMLNPDISSKRSEVILTAIGNIGAQEGLEFLHDQQLTPGMMEGLYRSFLSGNNDIETIDKATGGILHDSRDVRFWAAHILNRQRDYDLSGSFEDLKNSFQKESDQVVKIALAGSFRKVISENKTKFINNQLLSIEHPLVLVNLIRTLGESDFSSTYKTVISLVNHPNEQVANTAVGYLNRHIAPSLIHEISSVESLIENPNTKAKILGLLITHDKEDKSWSQKAKDEYSEQRIEIQKASFIRSLSNDTSNFNWIRSILNDPSSVVLQGAAHEVLLSNVKSNREKNELIKLGLRSDNVAMICQSAAAIEPNKKKTNHEEWIGLIDNKVKKLKLPRELEALVELQKAKSKLTSEPYVSLAPKYNHPINWTQIAQLPNRPMIELKTNKGSIKWELYLDKIPAAVSTIVSLIDNGYYDDKLFHRVVPNFVAQGGCPRGDGWGSLDFSLRSEYWHEMKYNTGAIGLASAGENTESCQFFMCHSPTPHLDNRYTIIGYVVEGLDVLNNIELGDKIISVKRIN